MPAYRSHLNHVRTFCCVSSVRCCRSDHNCSHNGMIKFFTVFSLGCGWRSPPRFDITCRHKQPPFASQRLVTTAVCLATWYPPKCHNHYDNCTLLVVRTLRISTTSSPQHVRIICAVHCTEKLPHSRRNLWDSSDCSCSRISYLFIWVEHFLHPFYPAGFPCMLTAQTNVLARNQTPGRKI